jgi:hypothetical protein
VVRPAVVAVVAVGARALTSIKNARLAHPSNYLELHPLLSLGPFGT